MAALLGLVAVLFAVPAQAVPERRVALVIGNSAYTAVPRLANPQRDATAISAALKRLGFEVVEGYDLRMDEMTGIVREFAQKLDGAKAGVVYYAGHGIAVGDENYLIPVDASLKSEADLDFRAVNVQLILRQMQRDVNVLILDACRDNPFATQLAAKSRSVARGLTAIETQSASGILIAFATDPRSTALDGEKDGNSPFTAALLKHIETPEVSITTVMDRVRADVWESTGKKQKPWTNSSIIGEFKLNPTLKLAAVDPSVTIKAIDGAVPVPAAPAPVGLRWMSVCGRRPSAATPRATTRLISTPSPTGSSPLSPRTAWRGWSRRPSPSRRCRPRPVRPPCPPLPRLPCRPRERRARPSPTRR